MKSSESLDINAPDLSQRPQHIAIIMDGNGRWAQTRGLPRTAGHKAGVTALRHVVTACVELNIPILTVFAFSSENWSRPVQEVQFLLSLFARFLQREIQRLYDENIRLRVIGDCSRFSPRLQALIHRAETLTANNTGLVLNIAANYGGRWDMLRATQRIAQQVLNQELNISEITEQEIEKHLCLSELPHPDLFIRTSGEERMSNFLLWQLAYSELYFTETYWPDFNKAELMLALCSYANRQRRFGLTADQLFAEQVQGA